MTTATAGARASTRAPTATSRLPLAIVGAAVVLYLAQVRTLRAFVTDDAFISLRYARNFARGFGPVWNPGGDAVEGFTNPLLVALESLMFAVGADAVVLARAVGVAAGLGLVILCWALGRRVVGEWGAAAAALFVAATPGLAYWSVGGLETLPMALVITAAALLLARSDGGPPLLAGALLALLPWIRAEGLAIAGALVFFSEIGGLVDRSRRRETLRRLVWLALLPLLSQVGLQALRWALYGNLVPNSVIYKAGTGRLGVVTVRFLAEYAPYVVLGAIGWFRLRGRARLLVVPVAVYLAASLTFLNSVNQFSRLLLPALPVLAVLAGAALPWSRHKQLSGLVVVAVAALMVVVMPASLPTARATADHYASCRHVARYDGGVWLRSRLAPGDVYTIGDAGVVPFYAGGTAHDIFGLNEPSLQETGRIPPRVRAQRALALQPRFLVMSSELRDELEPHYTVERRIRRDDRFEAYTLRTVTGGTRPECDYYLHIFEATSQ